MNAGDVLDDNYCMKMNKACLGPTRDDGGVAGLACIFAMLELCYTSLTPLVLA